MSLINPSGVGTVSPVIPTVAPVVNNGIGLVDFRKKNITYIPEFCVQKYFKLKIFNQFYAVCLKNELIKAVKKMIKIRKEFYFLELTFKVLFQYGTIFY